MNDNKDNNKERLQKQAEQQATGKVENKRQQEGYNDQVQIDPAKRSLQQDDSKVQNPNRNLAKGGNNMPYKKK
ncbi:hypothetical protein POKO110462_16550 [Pontibacter korlensis]|uniref:Uncharacterized protein n=1 Tax=Pontibacter korlensis TaxID=400092 RepID=A0A0E3UVE1_9BACT|nr:hypothetical protein [Pontibacter korlensis]AKD02447.1 hypothetical protein PKOR_04075 [Pontibacter korlensis]